MKVNAIITGTTGMVGEGVLHECLNHPDVQSVLLINRRPAGVQHQKLKEIIHDDFYNLSGIADQLAGYNACYFCLGTTSVGKSKEEYSRITFDLTRTFAGILVKINPAMTFCYVSGTGTDSSEKGKLMWARVKGKTENYILNLGFKDAYMFRPGLILPTKGLKNTLRMYKMFAPLLPVVKMLLPGYVCSLKQIGLAMINSVIKGYDKKVLEIIDIKKLAGEL
jgi:hypothetical protein